MLMNPAANKQPAQNMLQDMASSYGGTASIPTVQRSQYLADALQQLSKSGDGIKSWGALGSNLLAEALLQINRSRTNKQLLGQAQQGQSALFNSALRGTGYPGDPDVSATPSAPSAPSPPTATPAPIAPASAGAQVVPDQPTDPKAMVFAKLLQAGIPAAGAAGLVGNLQAESGPNLDRSNPKEGAIGMANWEGPRRAALEQYAQAHGGMSIPVQTDYLLQELNGPEAKAKAQLMAAQNPMQGAAAGTSFERPAGWMPGGQPQNVSNWQSRLAGAEQAMAYQQPPMVGMGSGEGTGAPPPGGPPMAPQGPMGGMGMGSPQMPPAAAPGSQMQPQMGAPPPQGGPPMGLKATPQEIQYIQDRMRAPPGSALWQQGLAKMQEIQNRAMTPLEAPKNMQWSPQQNSFVPMAGTQTTQLGSEAPGERTQQDAFGNKTYANVPGAVQNNQIWDASKQSYTPLQGLQPTLSGPLTPGTVTSQTPGSAPTVIQGPIFDPEKARAAFLSDPAVARYNEARTSTQGFFNALGAAAHQNNGVLGTAGLNSVIQAMSPGTNPRPTTMDALVKSMGWPEELQSIALKATGGGSITPEGLQVLGNTAMAYVNANRQAAQQRMDSDTQAARGYDPRSTGVPGEFVPPAPTLPSFQAELGGGQGQNPQQVLSEAQAAIARGANREQVIQRVRSLGINPSGL